MGQLIVYYLKQMHTKLWVGFLLFMIIFSIAERQQFEGNGQLFICKFLTDHYLIIFLMTPIFIHCISQIANEPRMVELIRIRHYYKLTFAKWAAIILFSVLFVMGFCIVTGLMSIGLEFDGTWQGTLDEQLVSYLMAIFRTPIEVLVLTAGFMIFGYSMIGCVFVTVSHFLSRKGAFAFIVASYAFMVIAFKAPWLDGLRNFSMSRFIILHHNFAGNFTWQGTVMIVISGFLLQFVLVKKWWYRGVLLRRDRLLLGKGLFRYYTRILFVRQSMLIWLIGLLLLIVMKATGREETFQEFIFRFFYGYQNGNVHVFIWLEQLIYVGIPIYLFAVFIQGWLVKRDWQLFIRTGSKRDWVLAVLSLIGLYVISYMLLTWLLVFGVSVLFDKTLVVDVSQLVYIFFMKTLELVELMGILFFLFVLTNNVTLAFLGILSLFVLNYFPFAWTSFNVAGLGQLARMEEMNQSMWSIGLTGGVYAMLLLFLIRYSYKTYFAGR